MWWQLLPKQLLKNVHSQSEGLWVRLKESPAWSHPMIKEWTPGWSYLEPQTFSTAPHWLYIWQTIWKVTRTSTTWHRLGYQHPSLRLIFILFCNVILLTFNDVFLFFCPFFLKPNFIVLDIISVLRTASFRGFVEYCLQKIPQERPSSAELLRVNFSALWIVSLQRRRTVVVTHGGHMRGYPITGFGFIWCCKGEQLCHIFKVPLESAKCFPYFSMLTNRTGKLDWNRLSFLPPLLNLP